MMPEAVKNLLFHPVGMIVTALHIVFIVGILCSFVLIRKNVLGYGTGYEYSESLPEAPRGRK